MGNRCPCKEHGLKISGWSEKCIGQLWLFEGLSESELKTLASQSVLKQQKAGEAIFLQGDRAQKIFLIKVGKVKINKVLENGAEIVLDVLKAGDCLGEYILNDLEYQYHYPVGAFCVTDVYTCSLSKIDFENMVLKYPKIGLRIIKNMARRITHFTERLEVMTQGSVKEKLYAVLLNMAKEYGIKQNDGNYKIDLPLTHEDLGFLIGAHRVSITRTMKHLKENGRITNSGRFLVVQDDKIFSAVQNLNF